MCFTGYVGPACQSCGYPFVNIGAVCVFMPGAMATCRDGVRNLNEVGVDCGGPQCPPCAGEAPLQLYGFPILTASVVLAVAGATLVAAVAIAAVRRRRRKAAAAGLKVAAHCMRVRMCSQALIVFGRASLAINALNDICVGVRLMSRLVFLVAVHCMCSRHTLTWNHALVINFLSNIGEGRATSDFVVAVSFVLVLKALIFFFLFAGNRLLCNICVVVRVRLQRFFRARGRC